MIFFVTGGSRGIGEAIVLAAIQRGHDVAFTYKTGAEAAQAVVAKARALDPRRACRAYELDVRSSEAVESVADRVLDDFETVDAVVANAGITHDALAVTMTDEQWRDVIDTNLTGAFFVARQFLPVFLANGRGRIIMISSLGHRGVSGQANYAASKAGLHGLSASLAKEYGRKGITSNVVVPGHFETDMTRDAMSEKNRKFWLDYCPAGRVGRVEEVAGVVLFLASDDARFVNGEAIRVDGGLDWAP